MSNRNTIRNGREYGRYEEEDYADALDPYSASVDYYSAPAVAAPAVAAPAVAAPAVAAPAVAAQQNIGKYDYLSGLNSYVNSAGNKPDWDGTTPLDLNFFPSGTEFGGPPAKTRYDYAKEWATSQSDPMLRAAIDSLSSQYEYSSRDGGPGYDFTDDDITNAVKSQWEEALYGGKTGLDMSSADDRTRNAYNLREQIIEANKPYGDQIKLGNKAGDDNQHYGSLAFQLADRGVTDLSQLSYDDKSKKWLANGKDIGALNDARGKGWTDYTIENVNGKPVFTNKWGDSSDNKKIAAGLSLAAMFVPGLNVAVGSMLGASGAAAGALGGALIGGGISGISGGNVLQGALLGGLGGGLSGAKGLTNVAGSLGVTNPIAAAAINGAARGAITGGLSSAVSGDSIGSGILRGGLGGGLGGGLTAGIGSLELGKEFGLNTDASKALNVGLANTVKAGLLGGSVKDAVIAGAVNTGVQQADIGSEFFDNNKLSSGFDKTLAGALTAGLTGKSVGDAVLTGGIKTGVDYLDPGKALGLEGYGKNLANGTVAALLQGNKGLNPNTIANGIYGLGNYIYDEVGKTTPVETGTLQDDGSSNDIDDPSMLPRVVVEGKAAEDPYDYLLDPVVNAPAPAPAPAPVTATLPTVVTEGKAAEDPYDYLLDPVVNAPAPAPAPVAAPAPVTATLPTVVTEGKKTEDPFDYNLDDYLVGVGDITPAPAPVTATLPTVVTEGKKTEDPFDYNLDDYLVGVGDEAKAEVTLPRVVTEGTSTSDDINVLPSVLVEGKKTPDITLPPATDTKVDPLPAPTPAGTPTVVRPSPAPLPGGIIGGITPAPKPRAPTPAPVTAAPTPVSIPASNTSVSRWLEQGRYGPIVRTQFAADGGLMESNMKHYEDGGEVDSSDLWGPGGDPTQQQPDSSDLWGPNGDPTQVGQDSSDLWGPKGDPTQVGSGGFDWNKLFGNAGSGLSNGIGNLLTGASNNPLASIGALLAAITAYNQAKKPPTIIGGGYTGTPKSRTAVQQQVQGQYGPLVQTGFAAGGVASLPPRFVQGGGDGMSDSIPAAINGSEPAQIADGEFIIPADVVSHLGNGSSNAGAQKLHAMMEQVRKARTGSGEQAPQISPDKFMGGGIASLRSYATGGGVSGMGGWGSGIGYNQPGTYSASTAIPGATQLDSAIMGQPTPGVAQPVIDRVANSMNYAGGSPDSAIMGQPTPGMQQNILPDPSQYADPRDAFDPNAPQVVYDLGWKGAAPTFIPGKNGSSGGLSSQVGTMGPSQTNTMARATTNNTTTNIDPSSSQLSPIYGDYVMDALGRSQALNNLPFQPYTGQRYADQNSLQTQAMQGIGSLNPTGQFDAARGAAATALTGLQNYQPLQAASYGGSNVSAGSVQSGLDASDLGTIQRFMNPYQQAVTDITKREADRNYQLMNNQRSAAAAKAGAFGGSRHGFVDAEASRNYTQQLNDIQAQGGDRGWTQAMDALTKQRASTLDADKFNVDASLRAQTTNAQTQQQGNALTEQSRQFGANNSLQALMQQLSGANTLSSMTSNQLSGIQGLANNQWNMGTAAQGLDQRNLDFGYSQFQDSLNDPQKKINAQLGNLQGLPLSTVARNVDSPNATLEALLAGGGLYNLLGGSKP